MRVYSHMSNQSPYKAEDWVTGTVYEINETIGAFVAVDHKYYGLIPKKELYGRFREGDTVQARLRRRGMRRLFFSQRGRFRREPGLGTRWRCSSIKTHRTA